MVHQLPSLTTATLILDVEKPTLSVVPGTTVRFHIVNLSARALFHVWFEGHLMSVIEVDGVDVVPYGVEGITIAIGQRYSILVSMLANPTRNYPIVAAMDTTDEGIFPGGNPNATAWLQYDIAAPRPPAQNIPQFYPFDDTALNPYVFKPVVPADRNITIVVAFANGEATMNGVSYVAPQVPTLFTAMNASDPLDPSIYGNTTNSFVLNYGDMIYLIVQNGFFSVAHPCIFLR
jgi:iron transport multicopper oxidase